VAVKRVQRIERQAVGAGGQAIASLVDGTDALMAILAERAQGPEHELVVIAFVRRVVISDRGRRQTSSLATQNAERLEAKLVSAPPSPALKIVPIAPMERLGGCEVSRGHGGEGLRPFLADRNERANFLRTERGRNGDKSRPLLRPRRAWASSWRASIRSCPSMPLHFSDEEKDLLLSLSAPLDQKQGGAHGSATLFRSAGAAEREQGGAGLDPGRITPCPLASRLGGGTTCGVTCRA
jgi:hypothetical protein